ncbi:protein GRINL1A [Denticeps clupeoides]|uniref:Uncharacterized protein n=1 Tax=Denticeps clupeoides TaxID=299321 RepID=A0AAY4E4T8_9TELE|nr:protein GRINL1A [Denticeps clupeoides]
MSSARTNRQGYTGDLRSRSPAELRELLQRQEKLLSNKKFVQTLPDKGKKISDFLQRVQLALDHVLEQEKKHNDLLSVRSEFESRYQKALSQRQPDRYAHQEEWGSQQNAEPAPGDASKTGDALAPRTALENPDVHQQQAHVPSLACETEAMESSGQQIPLETKKCGLLEALERMELSESSAGSGSSSNPFFGKQPQMKLHYVKVLEDAEKSPTTRKAKFKLNQTLPKSGSPSPSQSPVGPTLLSAETRKQRDRKHLDDITAAKLPPLRHTPAQLLTLQDSVSLLREQTLKQEELQAKLAAQKLAEGLGFSMGDCHPEGGLRGAYREVYDNGAQLSSEED